MSIIRPVLLILRPGFFVRHLLIMKSSTLRKDLKKKFDHRTMVLVLKDHGPLSELFH